MLTMKMTEIQQHKATLIEYHTAAVGQESRHGLARSPVIKALARPGSRLKARLRKDSPPSPVVGGRIRFSATRHLETALSPLLAVPLHTATYFSKASKGESEQSLLAGQK